MNSILVDGNIWEGRIVPYENSQAAGGGALEQCAVTNFRYKSRSRPYRSSRVVQSPDKQERKSAVMSSSPVRSEVSRCSSLTDISESNESTPQLAGVLKNEEATLKKKNIVSICLWNSPMILPLSESGFMAVTWSHWTHGADVDVRESPTQQTQLST
jgi:hypothetical protein